MDKQNITTNTPITNLLQESDMNQIKIDIIKEEISAGRYRINSQHIASKLLEFAPVCDVETV